MASKPDFKAAVLNILRNNIGEDITRNSILKQTQMSKSRLSEVLLSIKADGYNVVTPPRSGIVRLDENSLSEVFAPIKDSDIRQWIILFILSKYEKLTFNELLFKTLELRDYYFNQNNILINADSSSNQYDNAHFIKNLRKYNSGQVDEAKVAKEIISVTALRKDLNELRTQNYVTLKKNKHTYYRLTDAAPYILAVSGDSLYEFCQRYEEFESPTKDVAPLKKAYLKISKQINLESCNLAQNRYGRINEITVTQIETFNSFIKNNYKTNLIQFSSSTQSTDIANIFAVGLLFYSIDTSSFYALGENYSTGHTETRRLDRIYNIVTLNEVNNNYHDAKYYKIFDEMFSSSYEDEAQRVKVLFQDTFNIKKRFFDLCQTRKTASIRTIDNPPEGCIYTHIYEDTLRGISDFARFLRSFGMSVLALEPAELKEKMTITYKRMLERYETINGSQKQI